MLNFSEINIDDKNLFDSYLKRYNPQGSELTFTNLFMWRKYYNFKYTITNNFLCIITVQDGADPYALVPIGNFDKDEFSGTVNLLKEYFHNNCWQLKFGKVTENETGFFKDLVSSPDDIIFDHNNSDYIYLADNLINLRGKKYDGKRNHINKFKKMYKSEYVILSGDYIEDCKRIMAEWCLERGCEDHEEFYCEKIANFELLDNFDRLGCKGALINVDGRFEAFTVGEMLNSDTAVIHIEKAKSSINGLYTFINQQFCENAWNEAKYINREQDLGVEGLRKAKLSYNPEGLIKKYTVYIR